MQRNRIVCIVTVVSIASIPLIGPAVVPSRGDDVAEIDVPLKSVHVLRDFVLASTTQGLFRASRADKTWHRMPMPAEVLPGGSFAEVPHGSTLAFYYTPSHVTWNAGSEAEQRRLSKRLGLYVSEDQGATWQFATRKYDFRHMLLHRSGTLYGLHISPGTVPLFADRIVMSADSGKRWKDITNNAESTLSRIFNDPVHSNLICVSTSGPVRAYVLHATDASYNWEQSREWDYWKTHETNESFFREYCYSRTTKHSAVPGRLQATLRNYFAHAFDNRTEIPVFQIATDRLEYKFARADAKEIDVAIQFIVPTEQPVRLPDIESVICWGARVVFPDGTRRWHQEPARQSAGFGPRGELTRSALRQDRNFRIHEVDAETSYRRKIDLSQIINLSQPGTYRVQFTFHNELIADRDAGEWALSLSGPVLTVTVE